MRAGLLSLEARRHLACKKFVTETMHASPLYRLISSRVISSQTSFSLRSGPSCHVLPGRSCQLNMRRISIVCDNEYVISTILLLYYIYVFIFIFYIYNCMFVSALPDPTCNSEKSANGGNKQILLLLLLPRAPAIPENLFLTYLLSSGTTVIGSPLLWYPCLIKHLLFIVSVNK